MIGFHISFKLYVHVGGAYLIENGNVTAHLLFCSCIIPLPSNFVDYLQFDGSLVLPKGVKLGQITPEKEWEESEWENSSEEVLRNSVLPRSNDYHVKFFYSYFIKC